MWTLTRVRDLIEDDPALAALLAEARERAVEDPDPGHDLGHLLRVATWTLELGGAAIDGRSAVAAALLHDAVNLPKDSERRSTAGELSADLARRRLKELDFDPDAVDEIAGAVRDHGYSRGATPTTALGRALQDADRLDALGAIGIFRTLACGVRMGAELYDPEDPWAENRELDDRRFTLDHFFTKLLRLPETMNTEHGRREARARTEPMKRFLEQLGKEIGAPLP